MMRDADRYLHLIRDGVLGCDTRDCRSNFDFGTR